MSAAARSGPEADTDASDTMLAANAGRPPASTSPVIEVDRLTRKFNGFTAVDEVSFSVGRKEIFGFLGPNRAGKTTPLSSLCTLL